jgi:putative Mg2+ transporter-C (MgtC) family protein
MPDLDQQLHAMIAVVIAAALAALPGWDRERLNRPAGLRTHILVGVSSCMITVFARVEYSPDSAARLTANILTGIGFLGAGVILQRKGYVYDVTTAASIWMVALMGIVVGYEWYLLAAGATILLVFVLVIVRRFEDKSDSQRVLEMAPRPPRPPDHEQ